ncbi:MAG: endo-1,4-beta-xylanase, partial [Muribaculaceae bacterium]|nr:endo-1,4-beta-xylanase [Muribaculaceae bacterium]
LFIASSEPPFEGDKVHVKFRYRCTEKRSIDTQAHGAPGTYHHHEFIGTINATTQWQEYEWTGKITSSQAGDEGCQAIAFNLCKGSTAGYLYLDDVVFEKKINANTIPLTPEEKAEILETEMERWIAGMMKATQGYVKAWDVVNEAISGGPQGQRYDLQHAVNDPDAARKFYWQDYLGDDFVRIPVKYARKHFEENGGDPDELKLFVNDYNLESNWDDNQKLKSLISWIEQWESDGITKIDGIGSQMHVTYSLNQVKQKSQEEHVVKMLQLMSATGKLVRITELDMAISDENDNSIPTSKVTPEQHRLMADYYKFIIRKYFEIVPVAQQYGITIWCKTDSPEDSGWRPGEPTGVWDLDFNR